MSSNIKISAKAFGKLNLMLDIVGRRDDGYHLLETVMQSVSVYDILNCTVEAGSGIEIRCNKAGFPCDEKNLIWKAYDAFYSKTGIKPVGRTIITVEKNLPSMAGMAGGSADCAAMLHILNKINCAELSIDELCEIGVELGADVPFCISGGTKLCTGIGEKMLPLSMPECTFLIVKPEVCVSTPAAFKAYDKIAVPEKCNTKLFLAALSENNLSGICDEMFNVLEYACKLDEISECEKKLMELGADGAMMTGSGSAVFGIFKSTDKANDAYDKIGNYSYKELCTPVAEGVNLLK